MKNVGPRRILCIGDKPELPQLFQEILESTGYQAELGWNGRRKRIETDASVYDLVLVNNERHSQNGLDLLRNLANQEPTPPTVMLIDGSDESALATESELAIDEYLIKDPQQAYLRSLPAVIEKVLFKRQQLVVREQALTSLKSMLRNEPDPRVLTESPHRASAVVLSTTFNFDELLDRILDEVRRIFPRDAACILLVEGSKIHVARWSGYSRFGTEEAIASGAFHLKDIASLSAVFETGWPLAVPEVKAHDSWVSQSGQSWVKSYMTIPIGTNIQPGYRHDIETRRLVGFLNVDSATPGSFSQSDVERIQAFADQAAIALHNAQLYDQARQEVVDRVRALKKERNFISAILETAGALILILNAKGRILRFNRACEEITGYIFNEVRGKQVWELFSPLEEKGMIKTRFATLALEQERDEYESQWITRTGESRLIAWSNTVLLDSSGEVEYIISAGTDITERKQMEGALRVSEERYALAALSANDGLWDWDLKTNQVYFSPRWKAMLGYQEKQIGSSPVDWFSRVHPDDLEGLKASIVAHLEGQPTPFTNEHRVLHRNGTYRWVLSQGLAVRDKKWQPYRMAGSQTEITQRKAAEAKLVHNALHDALTDLPNRTLFMRHLERAVERAKSSDNYLYAVLFLDLDRFKVINDSLGHAVGDQLLISIAERLRKNVQEKDIVARLGGDEFAILLSDLPEPDVVTNIARGIQNEVARPIYLGEHEVFTSASIGIALSTIGYDNPEEILRDADTTMYQAKAAGRARHEVFEIGMRDRAVGVWKLEAELRQAIEREEFRLYYQPIISVADGQFAGVEALLRWHHPKRGIIMPNEFIPLAEEIGLIQTIGAWVLQTACAQVKLWHVAGYDSLRLALNVSPYQLQRPAQADRLAPLPDLVEKTLQETSLPAGSLELEITASTAMFDIDFGLEVLAAISRLGVRIAVDDFGMGSSIDLLRQFPLDTLKIDQSFIRDMKGHPNDAAFVTAIIAMAHSLRLNVVAEGLETEKQLALLQVQHCDEAQGNLYSPPLTVSALTELLQSGGWWNREDGEDHHRRG